MTAAVAGRIRQLTPPELLENQACQSIAQAVGCLLSPAKPDTYAAGFVKAANAIEAQIARRQGEPVADGTDLVTTQMEYELKARQRGENVAFADAVDALGKLRGQVGRLTAKLAEARDWFADHGDGAPDARTWEKDCLNFEAEINDVLPREAVVVGE